MVVPNFGLMPLSSHVGFLGIACAQLTWLPDPSKSKALHALRVKENGAPASLHRLTGITLADLVNKGMIWEDDWCVNAFKYKVNCSQCTARLQSRSAMPAVRVTVEQSCDCRPNSDFRIGDHSS